MTPPEDTEVEPRADAARAKVETTRAPRGRGERGPIRIAINADWCKGCTICVSVCPRDVLAIDPAEWTGSFSVIIAKPERCTACRNCELLCPDLAIEVLMDDDPRRESRP